MFFRNAISARSAKRRMIDERPSIKSRKGASKAIARYERETWFELDKHLDWQAKYDIVEGVAAYLDTVQALQIADVPDIATVLCDRASWKRAEKYILDVRPPDQDEIDLAPPAA